MKMPQPDKPRAPRNRTLTLTNSDRQRLRQRLVTPGAPIPLTNGVIILGDCLDVINHLPHESVDLLFLDPPYNLTKSFGTVAFTQRPVEDYTEWLSLVLGSLRPLLKSSASVYICGDWHTSSSIFVAASKYFTVRSRITWEREKGRGASRNWKNCSEDIWFCTVTDHYVFNVDKVKLRRKVLAPYRTIDRRPKDWASTERGNYRDTHPSNFWTDITIPFWSMPENTDHPTQKSEKLLARLMLASTDEGHLVLDPFLGSGTTAVVARKLKRHCIGIEACEEYCLLAERRLELANEDLSIQGYTDGVFWDRNTLQEQTRLTVQRSDKVAPGATDLFDYQP
jgi:site-specific DNA-methyltransferase (adenine-specific)